MARADSPCEAHVGCSNLWANAARPAKAAKAVTSFLLASMTPVSVARCGGAGGGTGGAGVTSAGSSSVATTPLLILSNRGTSAVRLNSTTAHGQTQWRAHASWKVPLYFGAGVSGKKLAAARRRP